MSGNLPPDTLELIYDAALQPALWHNVVHDIVVKTGGDQGALILQNQVTGGGDAVLANVDPAAIPDYFGHFATRNPMQQHNLKYIQNNQTYSLGVMTDQEILSRSDLIRTEYYNDFMRPYGMYSTLMIGLAFDNLDGTSIAITRPAAREDFGGTERELGLALQRHLIRALRIGRELDTTQHAKSALGEVLEKSGRGVFLTDADGHIRYANEAARRIVAAKEGLSDSANVLAATARSEARKFRQLLAAAATTDRDARRAGSMLLPRLSRRYPLSAMVMPMSAETGAPFHTGPLALVCVSDPELTPQISQRHVCDLFGLTPAEAKVAAQLLAAEEPKAIAETLQLSVNTVRVHMASIFRKTHTKRQAELVRLLMQMTGFGTS